MPLSETRAKPSGATEEREESRAAVRSCAGAGESTWSVLLLHSFQPSFKCPERLWKVAKMTAF